MRRLAALVCIVVGAWAGPASTASASGLPAVKHVIVIVLENEGYDASFGPASPAKYLRDTLRLQGKLLPNYHATGHVSLDNYIAMVSGQPPNVQTQSDCQFFTDFAAAPGTESGIPVGQGCVYPAATKTVADQLEAKGLTWKGYMEDMGNDPARDNGTTCAHPNPGPLPGPTTQDHTQTAAANDQYAARHNPFVYFHSLIDRPTCAANDVPLMHLQGDLSHASTTASLTFITPNLCHDGHDTACKNGEPGGLTSADQFLQTWVPRIVSSPAYQDGGMVVVTWDESENSDATACCNEQPGPNTPSPGISGPGGGRVGAVVVSPFVVPGTSSAVAYNHYSLLRTIEDLFGLDHLAMAAQGGLRPFGDDVFDRPAVTAAPAPVAASGPARTPSPAADPKVGSRLAATGRSDSAFPIGLAALAAAVVVRDRRRRVLRRCVNRSRH
jgi:hypothetical protein